MNISRNGVTSSIETDGNVTVTEKQIIIDLVDSLPTTSFNLTKTKKKKKTNKIKTKYMTKSYAKKITATPADYSNTLVKRAKQKLS